MDWKTVYVDRKLVGSGLKTIRMMLEKNEVGSEKTGTDRRKVRLGLKPVG
jgi:hypothetical protein